MRNAQTPAEPPRSPAENPGEVTPTDPRPAVGPPPPPDTPLNAIPLVLILVAWALLVFLLDGDDGFTWMLPAAGVAVMAAVIAITRKYPRRPRSLSLGVLGLFALYVVWVGLSALWAGSLEPVWLETALAGFYLIALGVALTFLTDGFARRVFRYLVIGAAAVIAAAVTYRLWTMRAVDVEELFRDGRLTYPLGYANGSAALFLVFFWPLLRLSADPKERAPIRGVSLGLSALLLCPWVLTQSRGALWALVLTGVLTLAISPARLRTLAFILAPLGILAWAFPDLNHYWNAGPAAIEGRHAATVMLEGFLIAAAVGWVLAALEPWIHVSKRMKRGFGLAVAVAAMAALIFGYVTFARTVGDPAAWAQESWDRFRSEQVVMLSYAEATGAVDDPDRPDSRFSTLSANGRIDLWNVAAVSFQAEPWIGVGAGNFVYEYDREREREPVKPPDPHGLGHQTLSETGLVGALLLVGAFALGLGGILWARFSAGRQRIASSRRTAETADEVEPDRERESRAPGTTPAAETLRTRWGDKPRDYGWEIALAVGFVYWLIHAGVDRLWVSPAVTIPPLLMLAAGVASIDARAGVMWPRWARFLPFLRAGTILMIPPMFHISKRRASARAEKAAEAARAARAAPVAAESAAAPTSTAATPDGAGTGRVEGRPSRVPSGAAVGDRAYSGYRRADKYAGKRKRRRRRAARQHEFRRWLYPPGPLSVWFRRFAVLASVALLVVLVLPYTSQWLQRSALAADDEPAAMDRARIATWLFPVSPAPIGVQADIYEAAVRSSQRSLTGNGARLDGLALALDAHQRAITRDPQSWSLRLAAGMAAMALSDEMRLIAGAEPVDISPAGVGDGSPARSAEEVEAAARLRGLTISDVDFLAQSHLKAAAERNPLGRQVETARLALAAHQAED